MFLQRIVPDLLRALPIAHGRSISFSRSQGLKAYLRFCKVFTVEEEAVAGCPVVLFP